MKKAIIYVRGNNIAMQELLCKAYAADKGYKVLYVTDDIDTVRNCDILLVTDFSRISRTTFEYYRILVALEKNNISIESVKGDR